MRRRVDSHALQVIVFDRGVCVTCDLIDTGGCGVGSAVGREGYPDTTCPVGRTAVEEDVVNKFYEAIDKLSEQQRQVLFMSMEGAKVKDIAEQLGISENSVKTQKKRAYAFVRNELGESLAMLIFILFS